MNGKQFLYVRLSEDSPGVVCLTLNRPPLNILHIPMPEELLAAFEIVDSSDIWRVLLIRAEGKCFSAGMDVSDHLPGKVDQMLMQMRAVSRGLLDLKIPTISALHGSALGGGLEIRLLADLTYAVEGTKLSQPEIKIGVSPPVAISHYPQLIGYKRTAEIIFSGETYTAEEAFKLGLINGVISHDNFSTFLDHLTGQIASYSRESLIITKHALRKTSGWNLLDRLEEAEKNYLERLMNTEDAIEGLNSFLQKRSPNWKHK